MWDWERVAITASNATGDEVQRIHCPGQGQSEEDKAETDKAGMGLTRAGRCPSLWAASMLMRVSDLWDKVLHARSADIELGSLRVGWERGIRQRGNPAGAGGGGHQIT